MMDIRHIARMLGGDVVGRHSIIAPGPGHSAADRSLSINFNPSSASRDGYVVFSHAGDDPIECRDYVRDRLQLGEWQPGERDPLPVAAVPDADQEDRIRFALRLWHQATDPRGTIVEAYLASRGLPLDGDMAGPVLRFHPALKFNGGTTPGMVALYRDIRTDEPCGIHRTFLDREGRKLDRKMLGRAKGAAIKLDADENVTLGLTIGEGIETCLSGRIAGFRPSWALGSADAIAAFPVLSGVECLTILGETDATGANDRATRTCARRWLETGAEVIAVKPKGMGDINDVVREAQA